MCNEPPDALGRGIRRDSNLPGKEAASAHLHSKTPCVDESGAEGCELK